MARRGSLPTRCASAAVVAQIRVEEQCSLCEGCGLGLIGRATTLEPFALASVSQACMHMFIEMVAGWALSGWRLAGLRGARPGAWSCGDALRFAMRLGALASQHPYSFAIVLAGQQWVCSTLLVCVKQPSQRRAMPIRTSCRRLDITPSASLIAEHEGPLCGQRNGSREPWRNTYVPERPHAMLLLQECFVGIRVGDLARTLTYCFGLAMGCACGWATAYACRHLATLPCPSSSLSARASLNGSGAPSRPKSSQDHTRVCMIMPCGLVLRLYRRFLAIPYPWFCQSRLERQAL